MTHPDIGDYGRKVSVELVPCKPLVIPKERRGLIHDVTVHSVAVFMCDGVVVRGPSIAKKQIGLVVVGAAVNVERVVGSDQRRRVICPCMSGPSRYGLQNAIVEAERLRIARAWIAFRP